MKKAILNKAVFTTIHIVEDLSPVFYVYHEEDDNWQFHGKDDVIEEDARLVSLKEILVLDESLLELLDLPTGYEAFRSNENEKWQIRKSF